ACANICRFHGKTSLVTTIQRPLPVFLPTAFSEIREMHNALETACPQAVRREGAPAPGIQHAADHFGNVHRIGGCGKFVGDSVDLPMFLRSLDDSVDETWSVRTKHPGDAQDEVPILRGEHILLSSELGFAVNADRLRF